MQSSVVVATLNGRDRLSGCLDTLAERASGAEVVVVNGPSTDGTTGMVRDREDVDVLVEIAERNLDVARNAGIDAASGDVVALLDDDLHVEDGWLAAVESELADGADVVTGPRHRKVPAGMTTESPESREIAGRSVTYFDGGNVAFSRAAVEAIDGFDEYLQTGGARDAAHRLAACGLSVAWVPEMSVERDVETDGGSVLRTDVPRPNASPEELGRDWRWKYRSLAYRLTKSYGPRPGIVGRIASQALSDAATTAREVLEGEETFSSWFGTGRTVVRNVLAGTVAGTRARLADRSERRNPNGLGHRDDRAVATYDWR